MQNLKRGDDTMRIDWCPQAIRRVWDILDKATPTYLVGGAVRDMLMNTSPHDWDLATRMPPAEVLSFLGGHGYRVIPTGLPFGTVSVLTEAGAVEITTFRREGGYRDGRHPEEVSYARHIEDDLKRRDFTMNAMALSFSGDLVDPFDGRRDLLAGRISAVGDAEQRFYEDPLRMLRAVRFTGLAVNGRTLSLDGDIQSAILNNKGLLLRTSRERQAQELWRLLKAPYFDHALDILSSSGLLGIMWPQWVATQGFQQYHPRHPSTVDQHLLDTARHGPTAFLRLVGLLHDIGKPSCFSRDAQSGIGHFYYHAEVGADYVRNILQRMAMDRKTVDRASQLVRMHMFDWKQASDGTIRRLMRQFGEDFLDQLLILHRMDVKGMQSEWLEEQETRQRLATIIQQTAHDGSKLKITGHDVMALTGEAPGPKVGVFLRRLQEWVDENPTRNHPERLKEHLLEMVRRA